MPDVVVTVPKNFEYAGLIGLEAWIKEGDPVGAEWSGEEWHFYLGGPPPNISEGEQDQERPSPARERIQKTREAR